MTEPTEKEVSIPWSGKTAITVTLTSPPKGTEHSGFGLVLGPGAGFRVSVCTRVIEYLFHPTSGVHPLKGCFLGGHSMGTRVAGTVAAQLASGDSVTSSELAPAKKTSAKGKKSTKTTAAISTTTTDGSAGSSDFPTHYIPGLLLLSYPLHTAEKTKDLRDQILYDIPSSMSTLFISGLKDTMCQPALFVKVFKEMKASPREVVQVMDADHSLGFGSTKPAQAKKEALYTAITEWTTAFMDEVISALSEQGKKGGSGLATKKKAEMEKTADEWTVT
ncbi:hypothetical protein BGZ65_012578, partial [Modicella reniformis]